MRDDPSDLRRSADDASGVTAYDRLSDVSMDIIAAVPIFGPIINAALRQVMPRDHAIYLASFFRRVADKVEEMDSNRVDWDYFHTPEFESDVRRVIDALGSERNRDKRRYYVAAMANLSTSDRPDLVERHRFVDLLERLRPSHLRLLAVVVRSEHEHWSGGVDDWIREKLPDADVENVRLDWRDMEQSGLLAGIPGGVANTGLSDRVWSACQAIGRRFASFVSAAAEDDGGPPLPPV